MKLHTIGDCHADRPWYFIDPSDTPFEEIRCNGIHYNMHSIALEKPFKIDILGSYMRVHPIPSMYPEENLRLSKLTYPYEHYFDIKDGDVVVFAFGEIDCRLIYTFSGYSETWQEMVDDDVSKYFEAIKLSVEKFNHLYTMIYNIIPPTKHEDMPTYTVEGTDEIRKETTLYVNAKFKEYCNKYGYIYFDIYNEHCDKDGYMIYELSDGSNHIFNPVYHHEYLKKLKF